MAVIYDRQNSRRVLRERLELHDIRDTERFAATIVWSVKRELTHEQKERLLADLISACWELSLVYDPNRGQIKFATFAGQHLRGRTVPGWLRKEFGRTKWQFKDRVYERQLPTFVSVNDDNLRLGETLAARSGDPSSGSDEDLGGLLAERDRCRAGDLDVLGIATTR